MLDFLKEYWKFAKTRKKIWMIPVMVAIFLIGGLIILTEGSAIAPFVYTVF